MNRPYMAQMARILGSLMVVLATAAAHAQRSPAPPPASPRSMLADQFVILAQQSLVGQGEVREDQLIRARILLDMALQAHPDDTEVWRLRSELAKLEKDRDAQIEALRQYVRRVPGDDAAQLELLMLNLAQHQTLDLRITAAVNMLDGPMGQGLSPAVQSRLASFVASSFHELGRDDEFGKRLTQALRLDSSNIAAARMAYELAVSRQRTPADIAQAMLNLVRANPADATTRRRFGESLLEVGLGQHAAVQFNAAATLSSQPKDEAFYRDWVAALILANQTNDAATMLDQLEEVYRRMAAEQAAGNGPAAAPAPQAGLPLELTLLRLVLLETPEAEHPNAAATESFNAVYAALKASADAGDVDAASRLALLSLICRRRIETVGPYVDAVKAELGENDPRVQVLQAWRHVRGGDEEAAKPLLVEAAARDSYGSYLVVLMGDVKDPRRQAVLNQIVHKDPSSLVGLLAARTLSRAGGKLAPDRAVDRISAQLDRWPGMLRVPNLTVQPWLSLQLTIEPGRYGYLEPIYARLSLRNRTDLPLSIGDPMNASALPRNALLVVSLRQTDRNAPTVPPLVVDMGRQLRLDPQQTIEVVQRVDRAALGALLAGLPAQQLSMSAMAVYDPLPGSDPLQGRTGLLGSSDRVSMVQVTGAQINAASVDGWLAQLDDAGTAERYQALARLALLAHRLPAEGEAEQYATRISERLAADFAAMEPEDQAWLARFVGRDDQSRKRLAPLHEVLSQSEHPLVRIMYVGTHADKPDSDLVVEAMRVRDPNVISFARAIQAALRIAPNETGGPIAPAP